MHEASVKEQFSVAYLLAVAARAGCNPGESRVDDDSVDWHLAKTIVGGAYSKPRIDIQLKCTENLPEVDGEYRYPLKMKNYNDLRDTDVLVPRILVVVNVPEEEELWLEQNNERLVMRRCGYWTSLSGMPESSNSSNVTIKIPKCNIFTPEAVNTIMENIANTGAV